jgi:hypothetical protein
MLILLGLLHVVLLFAAWMETVGKERDLPLEGQKVRKTLFVTTHVPLAYSGRSVHLTLLFIDHRSPI